MCADPFHEQRATVATACRILALHGLVSGVLGHVSVRVGEDRLLVRCRGPRERGLAVLHRAIAEGKGEAFLESFLAGAFAEGIDAGSDGGLARIASRAGLDGASVAAALADPSWRAVAEANRALLLSLDLWGVPSFRVDDRPARWGQDRLWAVERDLIAATRLGSARR